MTKTKRIERIQLGWSCCNPDHFHHHKEVAERCIEKYLEPRQAQRRWSPEMYADVIKQRESGAKFKAIGNKYGVGVARIIQVYNKAERLQRQADKTASSSAL